MTAIRCVVLLVLWVVVDMCGLCRRVHCEGQFLSNWSFGELQLGNSLCWQCNVCLASKSFLPHFVAATRVGVIHWFMVLKANWFKVRRFPLEYRANISPLIEHLKLYYKISYVCVCHWTPFKRLHRFDETHCVCLKSVEFRCWGAWSRMSYCEVHPFMDSSEDIHVPNVGYNFFRPHSANKPNFILIKSSPPCSGCPILVIVETSNFCSTSRYRTFTSTQQGELFIP